MDELARRLGVLEGKMDDLEREVAKLTGASSTTNTLIRFVILPLIVILGALVGVKIALPTG